MELENEPVAKNNTISFLIRNVIALGVAFGLDVSAEQLAAIMLVVNSVVVIVNTYFTRGKVTPTAKLPAKYK